MPAANYILVTLFFDTFNSARNLNFGKDGGKIKTLHEFLILELNLAKMCVLKQFLDISLCLFNQDSYEFSKFTISMKISFAGEIKSKVWPCF